MLLNYKLAIWFSVWNCVNSVVPIHLKQVYNGARNHTALILARGGSKQVPKKNLALLGDKSLLRRTIETALKSKVFKSVWVSTNDQEIYNEAIFSGAHVFERSEENASDTSSSLDAVLEFYSFFPSLDSVALIQCTSPFLSPLYLKRAHFMMEVLGYDSVFTVSRSYKLRWQKSSNDTVLPVNFNTNLRPRRQDMKDEYVENGMLYWFGREQAENNLLQGGKVGIVEVPSIRSLEIDSVYDLQYAQFLASTILPVIEQENFMCIPEEEFYTNQELHQ